MIPDTKPFLLSLSVSLLAAFSITLSPCALPVMADDVPVVEKRVVEVTGDKIPEKPLEKPLEKTSAEIDDLLNDGDASDRESRRKEIEAVINTIESQWNSHDLKAYMANYAEEYINNDGLNKSAVQSLTEEFWKTYPDARSHSKIKEIRVEGQYATVESRDIGSATTASEMQSMGSKGDLQSVSEGQQYLRRYGNAWKITGDRIDFEKVKVSFGLAKHLNTTFTAPEQVKAGKQYSARLEATLPPGFFALGSISNQVLKFPQPAPADKPRSLDQPAMLERVMPANSENHNELLTATVILVNPAHQVMGVSLLTRRLNVVPETHDITEIQTAKIEDSGEKEKVAVKTQDGEKDKTADKNTDKSTDKTADKAADKAPSKEK